MNTVQSKFKNPDKHITKLKQELQQTKWDNNKLKREKLRRYIMGWDDFELPLSVSDTHVLGNLCIGDLVQLEGMVIETHRKIGKKTSDSGFTMGTIKVYKAG